MRWNLPESCLNRSSQVQFPATSIVRCHVLRLEGWKIISNANARDSKSIEIPSGKW